MSDLERFTDLAHSFCHARSITSAINATRLWNWADYQLSPEPFWDALRMVCPDMFYGPTADWFRFTHTPGKQLQES